MSESIIVFLQLLQHSMKIIGTCQASLHQHYTGELFVINPINYNNNKAESAYLKKFIFNLMCLLSRREALKSCHTYTAHARWPTSAACVYTQCTHTEHY